MRKQKQDIAKGPEVIETFCSMLITIFSFFVKGILEKTSTNFKKSIGMKNTYEYPNSVTYVGRNLAGSFQI